MQPLCICHHAPLATHVVRFSRRSVVVASKQTTHLMPLGRYLFPSLRAVSHIFSVAAAAAAAYIEAGFR